MSTLVKKLITIAESIVGIAELVVKIQEAGFAAVKAFLAKLKEDKPSQ